MRKKIRKGDTMNTDIYIEYDEALADKVAIERLNRITLNDVAMRAESGVGKWIVKTGSWRKKCKELRYERPWSTTKTVFTATLKKPTYKKVK
jgi:hypothetical protein